MSDSKALKSAHFAFSIVRNDTLIEQLVIMNGGQCHTDREWVLLNTRECESAEKASAVLFAAERNGNDQELK
jgi:hypothetical protein